jgi:hypothetical protein
MRSIWLNIPLDLRSDEATTVLAATISLTPGTISTDISTGGRHLLVHALDTADPDGETASGSAHLLTTGDMFAVPCAVTQAEIAAAIFSPPRAEGSIGLA